MAHVLSSVLLVLVGDIKLWVFCKRSNYIHMNCSTLDAESSPFQISFHLLLIKDLNLVYKTQTDYKQN